MNMRPVAVQSFPDVQTRQRREG